MVGMSTQPTSRPSVDSVLQSIHHRWGRHAVFVASEAEDKRGSLVSQPEPSPIHSTLLAPVGKYIQPGQLVEISGGASSGKTSVALGLLADRVADDGLAAYVDSSQTFYPPGAAANGIDLRRLWVVRLQAWHDTLGAVEALLQSGVIDAVLWDLVGCHKELTGAQLQRLRLAAARHGSTLLLLTTLPTHSGSRALDYTASVRLLVHRHAFHWEQLGMQRVLQGYRLRVEFARVPGKQFVPPAEVTVGNREQGTGNRSNENNRNAHDPEREKWGFPHSLVHRNRDRDDRKLPDPCSLSSIPCSL